MSAVTGSLSMTMADGTVLRDGTDVGLARQWAKHEHGPEAWAGFTLTEQNLETAAALRELRRAAEGT